MAKIKYLLESVVGFIMTSPLLKESIQTVLEYDNSLLIYKIIFLIFFSILNVIGYLAIFDGLTRCFLDKNLKETLEDLIN